MSNDNLPVELWRNIFRLATNIPRKVDVIYDAQLLESNSLSEPIIQAYRSVHSTKLALAHVCKAWHPFALELIYEELRPSTMHHLGLLVRILALNQHVSGARYGWWTRRLEIPARPSVSSEDVVPFIIDILPFFPNLNVLNVQGWFTTNDNHDALAQALHTRAPNLAYLNCNHWDESRALCGSVFIQNVPSLRTLRTVWGKTSRMRDFSHLSHLNLTALSLSFDHDADLPLNAFTLPSLTSVTFKGMPNTLHGLTEFFEAHGAQLLSLGLDQCDTAERIDGTALAIEGLLRLCPNLHELLLGKTDTFRPVPKGLGLTEQRYPNIQLLGIITRSLDLTWDSVASHYRFSKFPNLKRVRLLDVWAGDGAVESTMQEIIHSRAPIGGELGIILEDALGNDI